MTTVKITEFTALPNIDALQQELSSRNSSSYLGTKTQDKGIIQFMTLPSAQIPSSLGDPLASYTVHLNAPLFGVNNAGSAPVIEHALTMFPNSRVTPEFRARVESDFAAFDEIVKRGMHGDVGVAWGWIDEPLNHKSLGEEATGFLVVRGWETMEDFENIVKSPEYAEAIPLLMAWEAPFDMWHIEKIGN